MHGGGKTLNNPWLARFVYNAATSLNITARRPVDSSLLPTASETSTHYIGTMAGHGRGHRPAIQNRPAARRVKLTVNHAMYCRPPPRRKGPSITSSGREVIRGAAASLPLDKGLVRVHACVHVHASLPLDAEGLVCVHACVHVHASLPLDQGLVRGALITCCTLSWRTPKRASGTNIACIYVRMRACMHACMHACTRTRAFMYACMLVPLARLGVRQLNVQVTYLLACLLTSESEGYTAALSAPEGRAYTRPLR